jgi:hypothetical protein
VDDRVTQLEERVGEHDGLLQAVMATGSAAREDVHELRLRFDRLGNTLIAAMGAVIVVLIGSVIALLQRLR